MEGPLFCPERRSEIKPLALTCPGRGPDIWPLDNAITPITGEALDRRPGGHA